MRPCVAKRIWPMLGCKVGQTDLIVLKVKLDVSCQLMDVYTRSEVHISNAVEKKPHKTFHRQGALLRSTSECLSPREPKVAQPWRKSGWVKTLATYMCSVPCVCQNTYPVFTDRKQRHTGGFMWVAFASTPTSIHVRLDMLLCVHHEGHHVYTLCSLRLCVFKSATSLPSCFAPRHHARSATSCILKVIDKICIMCQEVSPHGCQQSVLKACILTDNKVGKIDLEK